MAHDGGELDYNDLEQLLSDASTNLANARGKDLVIVMGKTGAGKSTLINYLQGYNFDLKEDDETGDMVLHKMEMQESMSPSMRFADMGYTTHSCTLLPDIYLLSEGTLICDTAGFGESRGVTKDMFTYLAIQMAIKASKRVKAVIAVVEECQLTTEKGAAFKSIAQTVSSIPNFLKIIP